MWYWSSNMGFAEISKTGPLQLLSRQPVLWIILNLLFVEVTSGQSVDETCFNETCGRIYEPHGPLVLCSFLPREFVTCENPLDLNGNETARKVLGYGCTKIDGTVAEHDIARSDYHLRVLEALYIKRLNPELCRQKDFFGGEKYGEVQMTKVVCHALEGIECFGNRTFLMDGYPCVKYTGHYFVTTLLYSVLLGFLGIDRFCLGHTGTAVGKLLTLGGLGIWWFVDIILLVLGHLRPEDGSNWMPYY